MSYIAINIITFLHLLDESEFLFTFFTTSESSPINLLIQSIFIKTPIITLK